MCVYGRGHSSVAAKACSRSSLEMAARSREGGRE